MRRLRLFIIAVGLLALVSLIALAAAPKILNSPGCYTVSPITDWDKIKNDNRHFSQISMLVEKPPELEVGFSEEESKVAIYGIIKLGSPMQSIHVAMGQVDSTCINFLYVDINNDRRLTAEESIELIKESPYNKDDFELQKSDSVKPALCNVSYARMDGTNITRSIGVRFRFVRHKLLKGGSEKVICYYLVETWFTGTGRFLQGKEEKELPFALIDGNDNGNYNDFGRDVLMVDINQDGLFDLTKEVYPLFELEEAKIDSRTVVQRRRVLFAWPAAMLVQPSTQEIDWSAVEPK